jgi:myo-inositol-1(or 4)-monophosphatase
VTLASDLALARRAVRAGAREALARFGTGLDVEFKTSAADPVSDADRASEAAIVTALRAERPEDGILGEEGAAVAGTSGRRWVVDGLDGTQNYLAGLPLWCVAVGLEDGDGPAVGAVCDPLRGELFGAARGEGCTAGGAPAAVRRGAQLDAATVSTYVAARKIGPPAAHAALAALSDAAGALRIPGCGSLELAWVAAGRLDGWIQPNVDPWDWVPGCVLVREAGGRAEVLAGDPPWFVAGDPAVAGALAALVTGS